MNGHSSLVNGLGFVCFVVFNPRVLLQANRVGFGLLIIKFHFDNFFSPSAVPEAVVTWVEARAVDRFSNPHVTGGEAMNVVASSCAQVTDAFNGVYSVR